MKILLSNDDGIKAEGINSLYDKLKEKLVKTRVDYFADLVIEAVKRKIILKKDIKNFDTLKSSNNIHAQCHASWTNWKNIFSYEIFGKKGYISINGIGGSYGLESLEVGIRQPKGGIPKIEKYEFPEDDQSWILEWIDFIAAIKKGVSPSGSGIDGYIANQIVGAIYESSERNKPVSL